MEYIKMNGLAYPQIDRHVEQIGDYSCADAGIEVIIFADCAAIYGLSRRYETGYDEEQGDFVRNYEEPSLRRLCTLSEFKTFSFQFSIMFFLHYLLYLQLWMHQLKNGKKHYVYYLHLYFFQCFLEE